MPERWEEWAREQVAQKKRCRKYPQMSCTPLRGEKACRECYEEDSTNDVPPGEVCV